MMQARARETKEAIVAAAGSVFGRDGFTKAGLNDICGIAGVTSGALYFHFSSKDDLARSVLLEYHSAMRVFCEMLLSRSTSPLQTIVYSSFSWGRRIVVDPIVNGGVRLSLERSDLWIAAIDAWDPWAETAVLLLTRAREMGELGAEVEVGSAAGFILGGFTGAQIISREYSQHQDLEQRVSDLWHYLLIGLLPRPEGSEVDAIIARVRREIETEQ